MGGGCVSSPPNLKISLTSNAFAGLVRSRPVRIASAILFALVIVSPAAVVFAVVWNSPSVAESIERYVRVPAAVAMKILPEYADPEGRINWESLMDQQRFYMDRGYTNYTQPIDLTRLNDDGPRQAALQSLSR